MVIPFRSLGNARIESQNSDTVLQLADDGWVIANLIPNQNMHPQILHSRPEQSLPSVSNERVPPGTPWLAASPTINPSPKFPDIRHASSPPGGPLLSNLYPIQSPVPSHNGYFESLQAPITSPPSGFQRALNVAPMEAERFIGQIARQVPPHFLNSPSAPPYPQAHNSYNAYPTPDYRNYFTTLPHEPSRDFGFGFDPYRPPPGTRYPFPHNNPGAHSNIFPHGPPGNPTHNFQQHHHLSGFLPVEYGPTGMVHRSFYASPPHVVPTPTIMHQATLHGNSAMFVSSDRNFQVKDGPPHRPFFRHLHANHSPRAKVNKSARQLSRVETGQSCSSGGARQIRRVNNLSPTARSSLLEEFRTNRDKRWTMKEIHGYVIEFSGDQHGSRFIQQQLEEVGDDEKQKVFQEIVPHKTDDLIRDVFGNYVIQKFFEFGTPNQKDILAKAVDEQIVDLSLQIYGCRVVQKAIEYISGDQQADFIRRLEPHVLTCVKDAHGNHVIQKLVELVKPERLTFLPVLADHILDLATHPYGCRVLQRCLEHLPDKYSRSLLEAIQHYTIELMQDQYGNYVIQFILEQGHDEDKAVIISQIQGNLVNLAHHKYASNVCEKALICTDSASREMLINEMMAISPPNTESPTLIMAKDQYANYVLQRALTVVDGEQKDLFFNDVKSMLAILRKSTTTYYRPLVSMERLMDRYFGKQVPVGGVPLENRMLKKC